MTLTLHTQNKMAGGSDDVYLFGEDFDAILGILEEDEGLKEQFESSASDVTTKLGLFYFCLGWSTVKSSVTHELTRQHKQQPQVCLFKVNFLIGIILELVLKEMFRNEVNKTYFC